MSFYAVAIDADVGCIPNFRYFLSPFTVYIESEWLLSFSLSMVRILFLCARHWTARMVSTLNTRLRTFRARGCSYKRNCGSI